MKTMMIDRAKPVAVISILGVSGAPQSQVIFVVTFCFLVIRVITINTPIKAIAKAKNIAGIRLLTPFGEYSGWMTGRLALACSKPLIL